MSKQYYSAEFGKPFGKLVGTKLQRIRLEGEILSLKRKMNVKKIIKQGMGMPLDVIAYLRERKKMFERKNHKNEIKTIERKSIQLKKNTNGKNNNNNQISSQKNEKKNIYVEVYIPRIVCLLTDFSWCQLKSCCDRQPALRLIPI